MSLWMVALTGSSPPNDCALSRTTEEMCVQQRCGVSGIDWLNSARGREFVVNAGDGSAHPDRRVLLISRVRTRFLRARKPQQALKDGGRGLRFVSCPLDLMIHLGASFSSLATT